MTDISLETGQTVRLAGGIAQVQPRPAPHHFKLTAQHQSGGFLDARCAEYADAIAFLRQLEPLGYSLRNMVRLEGGQ